MIDRKIYYILYLNDVVMVDPALKISFADFPFLLSHICLIDCLGRVDHPSFQKASQECLDKIRTLTVIADLSKCQGVKRQQVFFRQT